MIGGFLQCCLDSTSTPKNGKVDIWREEFYTACIWNVIGQQVCLVRARPEVHKIKMVLPVGSGKTAHRHEIPYLNINVNLRTVQELPGLNQLASLPEELISHLSVSPHNNVRLPNTDELKIFMDQCRAFVNEYQNSIPPIPSYRNDYGDYKQRCQFAANLALPSQLVYDDPYLMSLVINHHSTKSINQLLSIGTKEPNNCSYQGRRLLTIWLDFGAETQLMEQALGGAVPEFPLSVPEDVLEPTGETSSATATATATTSSGGGGNGSDPTLETGSSTLIIASDEPSTSASRLPVLPPTHQPVSVTPIAPGTIHPSLSPAASTRSKTGPKKLVIIERAPKKPTSKKATPTGPVLDLTGSTPPRAVSPTASQQGQSPAKRDLRSSSQRGSPTKSVASSTTGVSPTPAREGAKTRANSRHETPGTEAPTPTPPSPK